MISLENFFEKGYDVAKVDAEALAKLWQFIYTTEWIADENSVYNTKPDWYQAKEVDYSEAGDGSDQDTIERVYGRVLLDKCPHHLKDVANEIIHNEYFNPLRKFKRNTELKYLHCWNGAEEIPWHQDTVDGSDMLVLIYLTEEPVWDNAWGGMIGLRKELSTGPMHETLVQPLNGTMVILNNANPLIKHRVHELKNKSVNRYTFGMCFNWTS